MRILEVILGTKYPPPSNQVAGVYCGICKCSHNYPQCLSNLWSRIKYFGKYFINRTFRNQEIFKRTAEKELSKILTSEILSSINKEIIKQFWKEFHTNNES